MAFGLDAVLGGVSALEGIVGMFGANRRAKAAQEYRQRLLNERKAQLDQEYNDLRANNLQALRRSTGLLGDSLMQRAGDVGAAAAAAGVYNSSATAGAVEKMAAENAAQLQSLAAQNYASEQGFQHQAQRELFNQQMADASDNLDMARQQQIGAANSFAAGIGGLSQYLSNQAAAKQREQDRNLYASVLQKGVTNAAEQAGLAGYGRSNGPAMNGMNNAAPGYIFGANGPAVPNNGGAFNLSGYSPSLLRLAITPQRRLF